jgi:hypothetical protein
MGPTKRLTQPPLDQPIDGWSEYVFVIRAKHYGGHRVGGMALCGTRRPDPDRYS